MEPIEMFAKGVLAICAIHLASTASSRIESWWQRAAGPRNTATSSRRTRDDWYVFFHCSDLVGPDSIWETGRLSSQAGEEKKVRPIRSMDRRPRLSA